MDDSPERPVILIVGAGPGLGASVARRFARAGYDVALVARSSGTLERLGTELQAAGATAGWSAVDITDAAAFTQAVHRLAEHSGHIDVVHFNPSAFRGKDPLELSPDELLEDLGLGVAALLTAVQAARPHMPRGARVTVTGSLAADRPSAGAASLGAQKAALRNLVHSIDATLAPHGIRAMTLTVNGTLAREGPFSTDRVADAIYEAAATPEGAWRVEVPYDG